MGGGGGGAGTALFPVIVVVVVVVCVAVLLGAAATDGSTPQVQGEEGQQSERPQGDYCVNLSADLLRSLGMTEALMQRGGWISESPPLFGTLQGTSSGKVRRFHTSHKFALFTFQLTSTQPDTFFYVELHRGKASEDMIATIKDAARFGWTVTLKALSATEAGSGGHTSADGRKVRMESVVDLFVDTV